MECQLVHLAFVNTICCLPQVNIVFFDFDAGLYLPQVPSLHNTGVREWYRIWDDWSKNTLRGPTVIA